MPYLFRPVGAAAGRVDAEHDGLHVFVLLEAAQVADDVFRVDAVRAARQEPVYFAVGIVDGDDVSALVLRLVFLHVYHVFQSQHGQVVVFVDAGQALQVAAHVVLVDKGVHQSALKAFLGGLQHHQLPLPAGRR